MKAWFDRARSMENDPRVLQASNYPMQPWLDVAEGGWSTIVVTDNDRALAEKLADELADLVWSMRDDFQVKDAVPIDEAVRMADAAKAGIVVLSDTGDTVFGGSAGDSNLILESILRLGIKSRALIPMISPEAVAILVEAGEGAEVTLPLGGDAATAFFKPLAGHRHRPEDRRRCRRARLQPSKLYRHGTDGRVRCRPGHHADQRIARHRRQCAGRLPGLRDRAYRL